MTPPRTRSAVLVVTGLAVAVVVVFAGYAGLRLYREIDRSPAEQAADRRGAADALCAVLGLGGSSPDRWIAPDGALVLDQGAAAGLSMALLGEADTDSPLADDAGTARRAVTERVAGPKPVTDPERTALAALATWHRERC
jgi:hypothetical protein